MFSKTLSRITLAALVALMCSAAYSQSLSENAWSPVSDRALRRSTERQVFPASYSTYFLDKNTMRSQLAQAPEEFSEKSHFTQQIIQLPMPDGTMARFRVEHSLIVEAGLLVKFPELGATYRAFGIDDPTATARLDLLPSGFHGMILSTKGTVIIDPYDRNDSFNYLSYYKRDMPRIGNWSCDFDQNEAIESMFKPARNNGLIPDAATSDVVSGGTLRTYRLALAATGEYTAAVGGGTVAGGLAAQVLIMNRVNGVYERDVSLRMVIIANNNLIVYTDGATDPYTNSSGTTMLGQNQTNLDAVIGSANYDIGHVFSTGGGGVASLAVPCTASKARGVTGLPNPIGDDFAIDYVAHEMGHQWSANHTFNGASGSCSGGNRSASNSYEPGSGITIMAYAGICSAQDLAAHSIDTFHVRSLEVIVSFSQTTTGNTCDVETPNGNTPPTVAVVGGPAFNIPKQTPFTLTASGSDANGDTLTYDWQEYDTGGTTGTTAVPNTDADGTPRPIFRPYLPVADPSRTFPSLQYILNNANVPPATTGGFLTGELLPAITRTMLFQVIARDNRSGGGGINTATATVNVDGNSGPFNVTAPNTGVVWAGGSQQTVTWNVANTTAAPVSAANVKISLSTDGGQTFPVTILASTPNDGSQQITVPAANSTTARIKVEAVGNIFFDISDTNFTVTSAVTSGVIAGRIATASGLGIRGTAVRLTGPGVNLIVYTSSFGYFHFDNITFGQYTITPLPNKRYTFNPPSIVRTTSSDVMDVDFTAQ
jgi:hypothetical protein